MTNYGGKPTMANVGDGKWDLSWIVEKILKNPFSSHSLPIVSSSYFYFDKIQIEKSISFWLVNGN